MGLKSVVRLLLLMSVGAGLNSGCSTIDAAGSMASAFNSFKDEKSQIVEETNKDKGTFTIRTVRNFCRGSRTAMQFNVGQTILKDGSKELRIFVRSGRGAKSNDFTYAGINYAKEKVLIVQADEKIFKFPLREPDAPVKTALFTNVVIEPDWIFNQVKIEDLKVIASAKNAQITIPYNEVAGYNQDLTAEFSEDTKKTVLELMNKLQN